MEPIEIVGVLKGFQRLAMLLLSNDKNETKVRNTKSTERILRRERVRELRDFIVLQ